MKRNKKTRSILAMVLTLAMLLTGVSLDGTVANAATKDKVYGIEMEREMSVTMTASDTKLLTIHDEDGETTDSNYNSYIDMYEWSSSDNKVVMVDKKDDSAHEWCLLLKPTGEGSAVVTGINTNKWKTSHLGSRITIHVTVKPVKAKMTAKQRKCKHVYKVTKKATCERAGVKTCKKCKWQKTIAKKTHSYQMKTVERKSYKYKAWVVPCETRGLGICSEKFMIIMEGETRKIIPESPYQSVEELFAAYAAHSREAHADIFGETGGGGYSDYEEPWGDEIITTTETVPVCKYCGREKSDIEKREEGI